MITEQLQKVGIDAAVRKLAFGTFADNLSKGKFEAAADFFACGSVSEPWFSMNIFHERWVKPIGKDSGGNSVRWKNADYSRHRDAMAGLPLGDPRIDRHFVEAARLWLRDLPFFPAARRRGALLVQHEVLGGLAEQGRQLHPPAVGLEL